MEILDFRFNQTSSQNKENKTDNFVAYPDKFSILFNPEMNSTTITWNLKSIPENDYQKISIDMPIFNSKCRKLVNIFFF